MTDTAAVAGVSGEIRHVKAVVNLRTGPVTGIPDYSAAPLIIIAGRRNGADIVTPIQYGTFSVSRYTARL